MRRLGALLAPAVASLSLVGAVHGAADAGTAVLGEQRVLVVLVTWGPEPFTRDEVRDVVFRQSDAFYRAASYGRMHLAGDVTPWLTALSQGTTCNPEAIAHAGRIAAGAAGYARSAYDVTVYIHPNVGCAWSGIANGTETLLDGELFPKLVSHELGHTFGLGHANSTSCGNHCATEYGDPYDTMGSGTGDFSAYSKYRLGWLRSNEISEVTKSGDYGIDELEVASPQKHALVIRTARDEYWVENRRDAARTVDGEVVGPPGVLVRTGTPQGNFAPGTDFSAYNRLVADPAAKGRPALLPGERYVLPGIFTLTVKSRDSVRARVQLTWTDRTPPTKIRSVFADIDDYGALELRWNDPTETGSGIASFRLSIDKGAALTVPHDPSGVTVLPLTLQRSGGHVVKILAVDRAGNRGPATTLRFRT